MTYKYTYSPFIFLPNATACGYIASTDTYWSNSSCITTFDRQKSLVHCSCKHMSYYSIIEDYLVRPRRTAIVNLTFKNWTSFVVFIYLMMFLIIGVIYAFNKDQADFRYLHHQEELQGNTL